MRVNVNCALYGRCYAVARRFMLAAFVCCFFYGSTVGRDSIPVVSADASGDGAVDSPVKPLSVGDEVPDVVLNMINYPKPVAKLSDFRGKVVILDFWATWCGGCIQAMPKEDTLQAQFGKSIQFLLVNSIDKRPVLDAFLEDKKGRANYKITLPVVAQDSVLRNYFPFRLLPHYVLIDSYGKVVAITSSNQINFENIGKLIEGQKIVLPVKNDAQTDNFSKPYLNSSNTDGLLLMDSALNNQFDRKASNDQQSYVVISRKTLTNVVVQSIHKINNDLFDGMRYCNLSLEDMLPIIYPEMYEIPKDRWIVDGLAEPDWKRNKLFCIELIAPEVMPLKIAHDWLQLGLFRAIGISGQIVFKDTDCYIIERDRGGGKRVPKYKAKGNDKNYLIRDYISTFENSLSIPIVVKSKEDQFSLITVPSSEDHSIETIQEILKRNGYSFSRQKASIRFFLVTKSKR